MNRLVLALLSTPTIFGSALSILLSVNVAQATEPIAQPVSLECRRSSYIQPLVCERVSQTTSVNRSTTVPPTIRPTNQPDETPMLEFTDEESDAAIARFGCDCLVCINAIRQARGLPPVS